MLMSTTFRRYLIGLTATFAGAWGTGLTGSMVPLALGASISLMRTAPLVREIWTRARKR